MQHALTCQARIPNFSFFLSFFLGISVNLLDDFHFFVSYNSLNKPKMTCYLNSCVTNVMKQNLVCIFAALEKNVFVHGTVSTICFSQEKNVNFSYNCSKTHSDVA